MNLYYEQYINRRIEAIYPDSARPSPRSLSPDQEESQPDDKPYRKIPSKQLGYTLASSFDSPRKAVAANSPAILSNPKTASQFAKKTTLEPVLKSGTAYNQTLNINRSDLFQYTT